MRYWSQECRKKASGAPVGRGQILVAAGVSMRLEELRKLVPGRYFECSAKGKSSTLDRRDHRAIADLQDARILLLFAGNTREFRLAVVDYVPQPGGKAYIRLGGPETRTGEMLTVGARDVELAIGKASKAGGVLISSTRDNVTLTLGGPAKCKFAR